MLTIPPRRAKGTEFCVITNLPGKIVVTPLAEPDSKGRRPCWDWASKCWRVIKGHWLRPASVKEAAAIR